MLSTQKAKFRSALESTTSQMHNDVQENNKESQALGVDIIKPINLNTPPKLFTDRPLEFITVFKNIWPAVSQMLVATINSITNPNCDCITYPLSFLVAGQ